MHVLGVQERKCVNIMGHNAPEWVISFMGGLTSNCYVSGVYPTNNAEACFYQADHSEAELVVVDSVEQLKKYEVNLHRLPNIKAIVVYGLDRLPAELKDKRYFAWKDFLAVGKDVKNEVLQDKIRRQRPGKCGCLIYTSGTTGNPKACMLSHDNMVWTVQSAFSQLTAGGEAFTEDERIVSYLPLSHIAGLLLDVLSQTLVGFKVYFAKPDALQGSLVLTLQWARPTYFLAVPRVWEKMEEKLKDIAASKGSVLQSISGWAKGLGAAKVQAQ
jgi:long-chain-fatty-acid--CoA ligase ACSBG